MSNKASAMGIIGIEEVLLYCPVRGALGAKVLAKDGLTITEEARRVDFLKFLVEDRGYPPSHVQVEVVTVKNIGESGRNRLRADVIVYDTPFDGIANESSANQLRHAILVAEIKRESASKRKGVKFQLEPALRVLPRMDTLGVYWDDENRILFTKGLQKQKGITQIAINTDSIANLPEYGVGYQSQAITFDRLTPPSNFVALLQRLADVMRSHGVNDEQLRYKETVKLLLARYIDEKLARASESGQLHLQVLDGDDEVFLARINKMYTRAATRYNRARTLFSPRSSSELNEAALRDLVSTIESFELSSASSETMQQVFMTFVPVVFKKNLSQFFTPVSLIDTMVKMVAPGPTDKIADPAMGTADFLTSAMSYCVDRGDDDAFSRVYGIDSDPKAYDLAVINMILNRDGQANLQREDAIENFSRWSEEMDVVLCNPPFGSRTVEKRSEVLREYDLGHLWEYSEETQVWTKTKRLAAKQQLGVLFIERCFKLLRHGGRLAIILPEGYLCTAKYGYVRKWILDNFIIRSLVELPRRIFTKSDADLRSNILIAEKRDGKKKIAPYPIHASMVRRVGYKMGGDFSQVPSRDPDTGFAIRDSNNKVVLNSDFNRVLDEYRRVPKRKSREWTGASVLDIIHRPDLDMKPRRLVPKALRNIREIEAQKHIRLMDIADIVESTIDLTSPQNLGRLFKPVEGQDIRAVEGIVTPQFDEHGWSIAERKQRKVYTLNSLDIIVGLVRPERRNIGILIEAGENIVGSPDGISVVRIKPNKLKDYPVGWLFSILRSEQVRLQLWTESGGTSYGKLTRAQIENTLIPLGKRSQRIRVAQEVEKWITGVQTLNAAWENIGTKDDRRPILNSPLFGLFDGDSDEE